MHFLMGTGIYGQVKQVGPTPIVTKFVMLQLLPVYPLQSIYATSPVETTLEGIPILASTTSANVDGYPLARVDLGSVIIAYCRALCAALLLPGAIGLVMRFAIKHPETLDLFTQMMMQALTITLFVAVTAGALTYLVPLTNRRDAKIRLLCGDVLDACIDPAKVDPNHLERIEYEAGRGTAYQDSENAPETRLSLIRQLIDCRLEIAQGNEITIMEQCTDDLLIRIAQFGS